MALPSIESDIQLGLKTTLGVGGNARYFATPKTQAELAACIAWARKSGQPFIVLGGGSNVLVSDDGFPGLVIQPHFFGVTYTKNDTFVLMECGASEIFDSVVAAAVERGLWGIENLSGIPGTVGAVPIQNVGAYGVEVKDSICQVTTFDTHHDEVKKFFVSECDFGYRDSIFKKERGRYVIMSVTFQLTTISMPKLAYKDLDHYFKDKTPTLQNIRDAVCEIRNKKFPDWMIEGTAGSFFKNPIINHTHYNELIRIYPTLPGFAIGDDRIKVSLGWILDHICALRGYREGNVRLYEKQALVLVCKKGITSREIDMFAKKIERIVFEKTKIIIEREVTNFL